MKQDKNKDTTTTAAKAVEDPILAAAATPVTPATTDTAADLPAAAYIDKSGVTTVQDRPYRYGGSYRSSCLQKLAPAEPFFVLRAQDITAHYYVELWAAAAEKRGIDPAKVREARQTALEMQAWKGRKYPD